MADQGVPQARRAAELMDMAAEAAAVHGGHGVELTLMDMEAVGAQGEMTVVMVRSMAEALEGAEAVPMIFILQKIQALAATAAAEAGQEEVAQAA